MAMARPFELHADLVTDDTAAIDAIKDDEEDETPLPDDFVDKWEAILARLDHRHHRQLTNF